MRFHRRHVVHNHRRGFNWKVLIISIVLLVVALGIIFFTKSDKVVSTNAVEEIDFGTLSNQNFKTILDSCPDAECKHETIREWARQNPGELPPYLG